MSDLQTMREHLLRDLHIDDVPSGSEATDDVTKAIIEAMQYNRRFSLGFNQRKVKLHTENGKRDYKLPDDFLNLISDPYIQTSEDAYNKRMLVYRPLDWIEENEFRGTEWETAITTGEPRFFSIDQSTKSLVLVPIPDTTGHILSFTYQADPGIPTMKYTGSAWAYYVPGTDSTAIAATFTNPWLKDGYWLTYNRAAYILWTRVYGGTEEAAIRSQMHIQQWAEELNRLRAESSKYQGVSDIRRYI